MLTQCVSTRHLGEERGKWQKYGSEGLWAVRGGNPRKTGRKENITRGEKEEGRNAVVTSLQTTTDIARQPKLEITTEKVQQ